MEKNNENAIPATTHSMACAVALLRHISMPETSIVTSSRSIVTVAFLRALELSLGWLSHVNYHVRFHGVFTVQHVKYYGFLCNFSFRHISQSIFAMYVTTLALNALYCRTFLLHASRLSPPEMRAHSIMQKKFRHRKVCSDVKKYMNQAVELVGMLTEGYVLGAALAFIGVDSCEDVADHLPEDQDATQSCADPVVDHVVTLSFHPPNFEDAMVGERGEADCCCGHETGDRMVECSSRSRCAGKIWYHL